MYVNGQEWRMSFNTQYNNPLNGFAPGLNDYEISLYLTKAQKELLDQYISGFYSKIESFEQTEKLRRYLSPVLKSEIIYAPSGQEYFSTRQYPIELSTDIKSYIVEHNLDIYRIVEESALITIDDKDKFVLVKPERHDYYWKIKRNPFRTVNDKRVWRTDVSTPERALELISKYPIKEYRVRYINRVDPIIISDLNSGELAGLGLTIEGKTTESNSPLVDIHDLIVSRAVELATRDYKENNLSNQVQLNDRAL